MQEYVWLLTFEKGRIPRSVAGVYDERPSKERLKEILSRRYVRVSSEQVDNLHDVGYATGEDGTIITLNHRYVQRAEEAA